MTDQQARYIAIEGPIGVGKSSLARLLAERLRTEPIYEAVEENPFLPQFYADNQAFAFQTQMFFLMSRYRQLSELGQADLFNRITLCDYVFERDLLFAQITLNSHEYSLYHEIYTILRKRIPPPHLTVYLQADTATLMKRIKKRGRAIEQKISVDYIDLVSRTFNEYFFSHRSGPLLIINTNEIDFVQNEAHLDALHDKALSDIRGAEFFNPPAS